MNMNQTKIKEIVSSFFVKKCEITHKKCNWIEGKMLFLRMQNGLL